MAHCPRCGHDLSAIDAGGGLRSQVESPEQAERDWVPVARITGLAEAGFLEDLLQDRQIPSRVRQWDDFSALDGSWSTIYIMQVPAEHAGPATAAIGEELASPENTLAASHDRETSRYGETRGSARHASVETSHDGAVCDSDNLSPDRGHGTRRWIVPLLAGAAAFSVGYVTGRPDKHPANPVMRHTVHKVETRDHRPQPGTLPSKRSGNENQIPLRRDWRLPCRQAFDSV
ncbi:MAG: hypothetical protein ACC645_12925 [Pirellulales bacterium]